MEPTITAGEEVLVNRTAYLFGKPRKEHIIAFHDPRNGKVLIKRITEIKENRYFVLGDNKDASTDSRVFGWIRKKDIIGKAVI